MKWRSRPNALVTHDGGVGYIPAPRVRENPAKLAIRSANKV